MLWAYTWMMACFLALSIATAAQEAPMELRSDEPVLFLDDSMVSGKAGVARSFHPAIKEPANPLLQPTRDWELQYCIYGTVVFDRQARQFNMWHYGDVAGAPGPAVMYATSEDGIHWQRPALNLFAVPGRNVDNNICLASRPDLPLEAQTVLLEPEADPSQRYKMLFAAATATGRHYYIWYSRDGLRFTPGEQFTVEEPGYVDIGVLVRDPVTRRYRLYHRAEHQGRAVAYRDSADLRQWTRSQLIMAADEQDPPGTELYKFSPFPYGHCWVGLLDVYNHQPESGMLWPTLAWSRDGVAWSRHRQPFIALGGPGEWDRFNNSVATQPLVVGGELWFYYSGRTYRHDPNQGGADRGPQWGAIGLARLRLDGFCSLDANFDGGIVETRPFVVPAGELLVNAKADHGEVIAEVLTAAGEPLAGYGSAPIKGDGALLAVAWGDGHRLAALRGQTVRLRFKLRNARLYAFRIGAGRGLAYLSGPE